AKSVVESAESGAVVQTKRRAMALLAAVASEKSGGAKVAEAALRDVLGADVVNDYLKAINGAYKDYPASKAGLEIPRQAMIERATEKMLVRAGALDPFAKADTTTTVPAMVDTNHGRKLTEFVISGEEVEIA
ncbi:MAG: hypothetical protein EBX15_06415, partial [Acidimicrobiia bacterium]|nr:hypothetical protein [Acidimicrobiia bacterium]